MELDQCVTELAQELAPIRLLVHCVDVVDRRKGLLGPMDLIFLFVGVGLTLVFDQNSEVEFVVFAPLGQVLGKCDLIQLPEG